MKIISVVGARPNFIKLAALVPHLNKEVDHTIVHVGQHYDYELSKVFFEHLDIPDPHYYLGVGSGTHGYQLGEGIKRMEEVLFREKPDLVIVYGDTNSTLVGALSAVKAGFKVAHVEAGLRSYDMRMPEEINRRIIDHISWLLFAPTETALRNLVNEKTMGKKFLVGDVHVDVLCKWVDVAEKRSQILEKLGLEPSQYIVTTIHRAENTDDVNRLRAIVDMLISIPHTIIFPIHPRTKKALERNRLLKRLEKSNVKIIPPLGYIDFLKLLKYSSLVITDSGGVQREAYLLGKVSLVLRDRTEWIELVESGWVKLIDISKDLALKHIDNLTTPSTSKSLLGDGKAGERIAKIILNEVTLG
ncbi:MAG: non-hydrolyzing UDP-N-acetylglucosamine 2-epimerase [Candidatus Njordarchaeales archaeon]